MIHREFVHRIKQNVKINKKSEQSAERPHSYPDPKQCRLLQCLTLLLEVFLTCLEQ